MALIYHPALGVESDVPGSTVHIWRKSGWLPGPLPQQVADRPPVDESTTTPDEGDNPEPFTEEE